MNKRTLSLLLALMLMLSLCACSSTPAATPAVTTATTTSPQATTSPQTTTTTPAAEETTTTTIAAYDANAPASWSNVAWSQEHSGVEFTLFDDVRGMYQSGLWGTEPISQKITEMTGVILRDVGPAFGDDKKEPEDRELSLMLASGELPDFVYTKTGLERFENTSVSHAWDVLIEEHCPELMDLIDSVERLNATASDGHFYTLYAGYNSERYYKDDNSVYRSGDFGLAYRADVMNKLGLSPFTSVEGLNDTLNAVKDKAAQADISTVYNHLDSSAAHALAYWMGCRHDNYWDDEAKSVKTRYTDEAWLEYYKLMNRWYRDGILPESYPEIVVPQNEYYIGEYDTRTFALAGSANNGYIANKSWRSMTLNGRIDNLDRPVYEQVLQPLTYEGQLQMQLVDHSIGSNLGTEGLYITTSCHNPRRAILFVEFLLSPTAEEMTTIGLEGEHFEIVDGKVQRPEGYDPNSGFTPFNWNYLASNWGFGVLTKLSETQEVYDPYRQQENVKLFDYYLAQKKIMYEHQSPVMAKAVITSMDEEAHYLRQIEEKWDEVTVRMLHANSEAVVEQIWAEFQTFLTQNAIDSIEKRLTERFTENLARYQAEGYYTDIILP